MLQCNKRQKVIKRSENLTIFRCLHKGCDAYGQEVNAEACSLCPVRSFKREKSCLKSILSKSTSSVPSHFTDKDVEELIKNSPLKHADLKELQTEILQDQTPPDYPTMSLQLWLYKEALVRWNKAGRPVREDEEVEQLLNTYCKKCDWYDKEKKRCKGCGCKVTTSSLAVFNKLKMATEQCPRGLW